MSGTDPSKAGAEPSMDDILASIRKILNEDDVPNAAAPSIPEPPPEPLMLTEEMLVSEAAQTLPPPAAAQPVAAQPPVVVAPPPSVQIVPPPEPVAEPPPAATVVMPPPAMAPMPEAELVAPAAAAAAAASMNQLLRAVTQERSASVTRGGPSIEDVVREELRPMLKEWLDNHLPGIVERAVRGEIERVVGRGL